MSVHERRVELICTRANRVQALRQVSAIRDGFMKNRSQIWRLPIPHARKMWLVDLIGFDNRQMIGRHGYGSIRSKSTVWATATGRRYVELCQEAARQSNLSWHAEPYTYGDMRAHTPYWEWQREWLDRRERFIAVLKELKP